MSSDALKSLNSLIDTMKNSDKAHCQSYIDQINSLIKYGLKQAEEESDEDTNNNNNNNLTNEVDLVDILNISSKKIAQQLTLGIIYIYIYINISYSFFYNYEIS